MIRRLISLHLHWLHWLTGRKIFTVTDSGEEIHSGESLTMLFWPACGQCLEDFTPPLQLLDWIVMNHPTAQFMTMWFLQHLFHLLHTICPLLDFYRIRCNTNILKCLVDPSCVDSSETSSHHLWCDSVNIFTFFWCCFGASHCLTKAFVHLHLKSTH